MMNGYIKYFPLIVVACSVVLGGAQESEPCKVLLSKCSNEAQAANALTQTEITRILNEWRKTRNVVQEDKDRICKYSANLQACYDQIKQQCESDTSFKIESSGPKTVSEMVKCANVQLADPKACSNHIMACANEGLNTGGLSLKDFESGDLSTIMKKIEQLDICKVLKTFNQCYTKTPEICNPEVDKQIKMIASLQVILQCDNPASSKCLQKGIKCGAQAVIDSGVTVEDLTKFQPASIISGNTGDIISSIGKDKICKFVKSFQECGGTAAKEECSAIPTVGSAVDQLKSYYEKEKCGCASAVASLVLTLFSIFLVFYFKSK